MTGTVFDIKEFSVHDGPGVRTTVFMKGCPLSCRWCHNPEGLSPEPELMVRTARCRRCGRCMQPCNHPECKPFGRCLHACPDGLVSIAGKVWEADALAEKLLQNADFMQMSGGGVTISGGEPLAHSAFTAELLRKLRADGIHTAIETSGYASPAVFREIAPLCDLLLFDLKETDPALHKKYTGVELEPILSNLRMAGELGVPVHLRMPIIPGLNDREEHFAAAAEIARTIPTLVTAQVMPYHKLGAYKYETLGGSYTLSDIEEPDAETKKRWQAMMDEGIKK